MVPTFELEKKGVLAFLLKMYCLNGLGTYLTHQVVKLYCLPINVHIPGDSSRDLFIPQLQVISNHLKGHFFHHPKKVTIAELPGILFSHPTSTLLGCPKKLVKRY